MQAPFPVVDLRFEVQLDGALQLPPFPGGLLRGAFGSALRRLSCMTGFRTCVGCPLRATCPYPLLFEPPPADLSSVGLGRTQDGLPPPFILRLPEIDPGADGQFFFGMRLVGGAIDRLAFVIEAWRRVFAHGLGRERVRGTLVCVRLAADGTPIWSGEEIVWPEPQLPSLAAKGAELMLLSRTPMRLQARGDRLPLERLTARAFVAAIIRRARLLALHADAQAQAVVRSWPVGAWLDQADAVAQQQSLVWRDWYRFSARQKQRMNLGGYVGRWAWSAVPPELQRLLSLGELLHVGKEASFGLGAYAIFPREAAA
ncbi:MAG: CRISPR system precrRNA processing endoribonuclease RAMP protein Cas6 [Sphingomonadaceae bacterium]